MIVTERPVRGGGVSFARDLAEASKSQFRENAATQYLKYPQG
jgi:hypothetical protein